VTHSALLLGYWALGGDVMTKAEQTRLVTWRMKVLEHAGSGTRQVAQTC